MRDKEITILCIVFAIFFLAGYISVLFLSYRIDINSIISEKNYHNIDDSRYRIIDLEDALEK